MKYFLSILIALSLAPTIHAGRQNQPVVPHDIKGGASPNLRGSTKTFPTDTGRPVNDVAFPGATKAPFPLAKVATIIELNILKVVDAAGDPTLFNESRDKAKAELRDAAFGLLKNIKDDDQASRKKLAETLYEYRKLLESFPFTTDLMAGLAKKKPGDELSESQKKGAAALAIRLGILPGCFDSTGETTTTGAEVFGIRIKELRNSPVGGYPLKSCDDKAKAYDESEPVIQAMFLVMKDLSLKLQTQPRE